MPLELKYLAVVESTEPKGEKPCGRYGIVAVHVRYWEDGGLKVNSYVDDRNDPLKVRKRPVSTC